MKIDKTTGEVTDIAIPGDYEDLRELIYQERNEGELFWVRMSLQLFMELTEKAELRFR